MPIHSTQHDDWEACQPGEIAAVAAQLSSQEAARTRTRALRSGVAGAAVVLLAIGAAFWVLEDSSKPAIHGGITCAQCIESMPDYHAHLVQHVDFDANLSVGMKEHLEHCGICRARFESQFPGVLSLGLETAGRQLARAPFGWGVLALVFDGGV